MEGDAGALPGRTARPGFLIHYGWKETNVNCENNHRNIGFLIHYGWRETRQRFDHRRTVQIVSNPLRLEGDIAEITIDSWEKLVSNPLRLEGDTLSWANWIHSIYWFLIHYGWRETFQPPCMVAVVFTFLIHYGWRETRNVPENCAFYPKVSNPLRLEGDGDVDPATGGNG